MELLSSIKSGRNLARRAIASWSRHDCTTQAAAISFYAALSLFPLVAVLISGVGLFLKVIESRGDATEYVLTLLSETFSPEMSAAVAHILGDVQTQAWIGGPIAAIVLLYLSSRVFAQVDHTFYLIWKAKSQEKRSLRVAAKMLLFNRLRSLAIVAAYGLAVILIFFGGTILYTLESFVKIWLSDTGPIWSLKSHFLSLISSTLVFGVVYRFLSKGPVRTRLCFGTGLLVAILWEVGRLVLANVVVGERYTPLGVVGSFLGILLWIYYSNLALLAGAVWIQVITSDESPPTENDPR